MAKPNSVRGFDRTDYEIRGEEEFHRAELSVKMRGGGIWKGYKPTPEEVAEWEKIPAGNTSAS